jgi:ubiquinone/menaquinone biosynthesis C-methylase UbiE
MEPLFNYFIDIKAENILDIGTGKGGFIPVLLQTFPGAVITGIDPSNESIDVARQHYPGINFKVMGAEKLRYKDDSFDVVSISMALHHLAKVKKSLKEIKRVVKPGGYVIINEPISDNLNPAQEVHKMYHHFRSRIDRLLGTFHRKTFTKKAILQMLKTAELPVQFYFEQRKNTNLAEFEGELDLRVEKMKQMLEEIKGRPEYELLKPQIEEFRVKASKRGFQPAPNLVIVVRKILLPDTNPDFIN